MPDFLKVWQPEDNDVGQNVDLRLLHAQYCEFAARMESVTGKSVPVRDFHDFAGWLCSLAPDVRAAAEERYRKGYDVMIAEGQDEVRDYLVNIFKDGKEMT